MFPFPFKDSWRATEARGQGSMINIQRGQYQPGKGSWRLAMGLAACQGANVLPQNAFFTEMSSLELGEIMH